jgi:hypothetical protein
MNKQPNVCRYCLFLKATYHFCLMHLLLFFTSWMTVTRKGLENQTFLSAQEKEPLYVCRPLLQRSESGKRQ